MLIQTLTSQGSFEDYVRACPYTLLHTASGEHLVNVSHRDGWGRGDERVLKSGFSVSVQYVPGISHLPVYFMITLKGTDSFQPSLMHCILNFS